MMAVEVWGTKSGSAFQAASSHPLPFAASSTGSGTHASPEVDGDGG